MAVQPTIAETIQIGDVSIYLSGNDNSLGALFGKRLSSPYSDVEIATITDAIRWQYEGYPTDPTLRGTCNYGLWMFGKYGLQAQYIISGSGGGTVTPGTGGTRPTPLEFVVASTAYMVDGQSGLTIPSYIGYNLSFSRGGIDQSTVNSQSSYFSWDRNTGTFTCVPAAADGELFIIKPI